MRGRLTASMEKGEKKEGEGRMKRDRIETRESSSLNEIRIFEKKRDEKRGSYR